MSQELDVPVPCPACKGFGTYAGKDFMGRYESGICTACGGSCIMYLTEAQYAKRIGDTEREKSHRPYTSEEKRIIGHAKTPKVAFDLLMERGYTDRKFDTIKKYRIRQRKENERRRKNSGN